MERHHCPTRSSGAPPAPAPSVLQAGGRRGGHLGARYPTDNTGLRGAGADFPVAIGLWEVGSMAQRRTSARPACGLKQSLEFLNKSGQSTGSEWDSPQEPGCRYTSKAPALAPVPLVNKDPPPLCCWPVLQMWTESLPSPCPAAVHLPEVDTEVPMPLGQPHATQMPLTILNTPSLSL